MLLSNDMHSTLKIDNQVVGNVIDITSGTKNIVVSETLSGKYSSAGNFSGSDLLRINYE